MNLESQVCRLEFAKRFKELGVKQESFAYWDEHYTDPFLTVGWPEYGRAHLGSVYSAFTVAELGEGLKEYCGLDHQDMPRWYKGGPNDDSSWVVYVPDIDGEDYELTADTEANARAKMLIYLLENKLISV